MELVRRKDRQGAVRQPRLLLRFGVLSAVLVSALGITTGLALGKSIRTRTIDDAVRTAQVLADSGIRPFVSPEDLAGDFTPLSPRRRAELDSTLGTSLSSNGIVRLKLWNLQHWLVYSDKDEIMSRWFPADTALNDAFAGRITSVITDLSKPEEQEERDFGRLLSVYVPLRVDESGNFTGNSQGKIVGAFEIYLPYKPIAAAIRSDSLNLYKTLGVGLILLYLGLFQLMRSASLRLRRQAAQNQHQALHDALTTLPNRVLFRDRGDRAIALAARQGTVVSVLLLDVDRFKELNDSLGHQLGDQLLVKIGERLNERLRDVDTVARLGGDEFAVLLVGLAHAADAAIVAQDLEALFEEPFAVGSITVDVRVSIGIASSPDNGDDTDALLRHADVAMYQAKAAHTGVESYNADADHYRPERLALAGDVRRAIGANELVLFYQPKLDLATNRIVGCEALVRWQHPERGLLSPGLFMPVIESTELIKPLTLHLIDQAMHFSRQLRDIGHHISIAVNLAARNTVDTRLPEQVAEIMHRYDLPFDALELELTESAVLDNPNRAQMVLEEISALGVPISVDDFGTGYASISYLTQLPISVLKIDQSFVGDVTVNPKSEAVVSFTVALATSLRLKVVAEGVEDRPTIERLGELGCDQAQGYFIAKPMPAAALIQLLDVAGAHVFDKLEISA